MAESRPQSLRRLLLTHELAFLILVAVAGLLGGVWAYFWQQTSAESIRLNGLAHIAQELRSDLFRQINEVALARLRDDPSAEGVYLTYTKSIKVAFNQLRQRSDSRAEAYAIQELQEAYGSIQVDMNAIFDDPYLLNRIVRSKLLDPAYEQALVENFENGFAALRGLINQQLDAQLIKIERWTRFASIAIPLPIVVAIVLLLFSRASLMRGFVRPVQSVVAGIRRMSAGELSVPIATTGVSEVGEIARGISDMAEELGRSRDALVDHERQAALGALVPVVAHNIRNPLASIRASAQLIEPDLSDTEIKESQRAIIETVDRLERWVSALVSYLHPLKPQPRTVLAVSLIDGTVALLEQKIREKSVNIERQPWTASVAVTVDPDLMEQALYAVLINAIEASPPGATVRISVVIDADRVVFGIEDQGGGIPFTPQPTELEPGPTTKRMGTGLGIPVAFKVCLAHGWDISYETVAGEGTRVLIAAPI